MFLQEFLSFLFLFQSRRARNTVKLCMAVQVAGGEPLGSQKRARAAPPREAPTVPAAWPVTKAGETLASRRGGNWNWGSGSG